MSRAKNDTRAFHFKQFSLNHHRSTMKTGTDAILLGVWTDVSEVTEALDIGSGSGIISLFIAARSNANVISIEIDNESVDESNSNYASSRFGDRMKVLNTDFVSYADSTESKFDLIVSNPPFFTNDLHSPDERKTIARHTDSLSFSQLCSGVSQLLKVDGRFTVVLPYSQYQKFCDIAREYKLFVFKELLIFPRRGLEPNRINIEFKRSEILSLKKEFFIIREENNKFTDQYREILGKYYTSIPEQ